MKKNIKDHFLTLNRNELVYLARQYETPVLVGFPRELLVHPGDRDEMIEKSLLDKGFVKEVDGKLFFLSKPELLRTLFNPDRALLVVRNHTTLGIQRNIFCGRKDHFILHVQPDEATHKIREVPANSIYPAVLEWLKFDFERFEGGITLAMPEQDFEDFRVRVEKNGIDTVSADETNEVEAKIQLAEAIHTREFSASVASLKIEKDVAKYALSFSLLVGKKSAWLFTAQPNQPGYLRIETIGKEFPSILQGITRSIVEDAQSTIQSFVLSEETLAYCLAAINRADLGLKLLGAKYGQLTEDKVAEILTKARDVLIKANLCTATDADHTKLNDQLERAVFPMAMCDYLIRADIIKSDFYRRANLYTQKGKLFSSVIRADDKIYLEHGKTSGLGKYLVNVYADFGKATKTKLVGKQNIRLDFLQELMASGNDPVRVKALLVGSDLPDELCTLFEKDAQEQEYRGVIQIIDAKQKSIAQGNTGRPRKTLLLMQSFDRSWLFEFPDTNNNPAGKIHLVDREKFQSILDNLLSD